MKSNELTKSHTEPKNRRSAKSTSKGAQYQRILDLLRSGKKNTYELRRAGVMAPAARIREMKDNLGYDIRTVDRISIFDEEGYPHPGVAVYQLMGEPS